MGSLRIYYDNAAKANPRLESNMRAPPLPVKCGSESVPRAPTTLRRLRIGGSSRIPTRPVRYGWDSWEHVEILGFPRAEFAESEIALPLRLPERRSTPRRSTGLLNVFKVDDSPRVCQECLRETCMLHIPLEMFRSLSEAPDSRVVYFQTHRSTLHNPAATSRARSSAMST